MMHDITTFYPYNHPPMHLLHTKILVIMGATGTGKSRLSIDLATRYFPCSEIINADKIQLYKGLDITTNKLPLQHRLSVPHHLLSHLPITAPELTPPEYGLLASSVMDEIAARRNLPILVGGSNSFIQALVHNPITSFRYRCCFLWLQADIKVLKKHLCRRVDQMVQSGMVNELAHFYCSDYLVTGRTGIGKAIGVDEFEPYFRRGRSGFGSERCYEGALKDLKVNTCRLAVRQMEKIQRLRDTGWDLNKIDATAAFAVTDGNDQAVEAWEKDVIRPSVGLINKFLGL